MRRGVRRCFWLLIGKGFSRLVFSFFSFLLVCLSEC